MAVACVLAAAGGGYAAGRSGGADIHQATTVGKRAGRARGALDRRAYRAALSSGRSAGYRQAYRQAYRTAFTKTSHGAGP